MNEKDCIFIKIVKYNIYIYINHINIQTVPIIQMTQKKSKLKKHPFLENRFFSFSRKTVKNGPKTAVARPPFTSLTWWLMSGYDDVIMTSQFSVLGFGGCSNISRMVTWFWWRHWIFIFHLDYSQQLSLSARPSYIPVYVPWWKWSWRGSHRRYVSVFQPTVRIYGEPVWTFFFFKKKIEFFPRTS